MLMRLRATQCVVESEITLRHRWRDCATAKEPESRHWLPGQAEWLVAGNINR